MQTPLMECMDSFHQSIPSIGAAGLSVHSAPDAGYHDLPDISDEAGDVDDDDEEERGDHQDELHAADDGCSGGFGRPPHSRSLFVINICKRKAYG